MLPPVHLAVAYLLYAALACWRTGDPPGGRATLAAIVGGALPDLIDQPLFYALGLSSTRTLGHSLLVAVPVSVLALVLARRGWVSTGVAVAFAMGYLAHPAADALWPLVYGAGEELGFLLWPLLHSPDYPSQRPLLSVAGTTVTTTWAEIPLLVTVLVVWWRDGAPGVRRW
ncbi:hydrolase [Halobacteriales archaeon QS_1_68_20]|nr:MAG: hydrolase [Halobacteriales archaeon QS_1_68_20]